MSPEDLPHVPPPPSVDFTPLQRRVVLSLNMTDELLRRAAGEGAQTYARSLSKAALGLLEEYPRRVQSVKDRIEANKNAILDSWVGKIETTAEERSQVVSITSSLRRCLKSSLRSQLQALEEEDHLVGRVKESRSKVEALYTAFQDSLEIRRCRGVLYSSWNHSGTSKSLLTCLLSRLAQIDEVLSKQAQDLDSRVRELQKFNELLSENVQFLYLGRLIRSRIQVSQELTKTLAAEGRKLWYQWKLEVDEAVRSRLVLEAKRRFAAIDQYKAIGIILERVLDSSPGEAFYKCKMWMDRCKVRGGFC